MTSMHISMLAQASPRLFSSIGRGAVCFQMSLATFASDATVEGELPPWEVARAYAFHVVLKQAGKYAWSGLLRVVVHDKASYMVTAAHERLHVTFAAGLTEGGFRSWVGVLQALAVFVCAKAFLLDRSSHPFQRFIPSVPTAECRGATTDLGGRHRP